MRLSIDCRELNRKTVRDRHPTPRNQETLDNLGGSSWFSVLDQGKHIIKASLRKTHRSRTTFSPVQDRKLAASQSSQLLPANQHDGNEETSHGGETDAAEFQEPVEPVEESSERNLSESGETHERPTRQRRAPTMLTYGTLGIPSFYPRTTINHTVCVTPSAPTFRGTVVGPPSYTGLNCVWPWHILPLWTCWSVPLLDHLNIDPDA